MNAIIGVTVIALAACGHAPSPTRAASGSPVATIPFQLYGNLVLLDVAIAGGPPRTFLLDSGWNPSALDADVAKELAISASAAAAVAAPGGDVQLAKAPHVTLSIGPLPFEARDVDLVPLHPLAQVIGRSFDGIIGNDLFARYVVEIDYAHHTISLYEPTAYAHGGGEVLPLEVTGGETFIHATIVAVGKRHDAKLKLDTGSVGGLGLNGSYVQSTALFPATTPTITMLGAAVGGRTKNFASRADALVLGSVSIPQPVVGYSEDLTRGGDAGTLGGEILRRFKVTFDQAHHQLVLEPGPDVAARETWDMVGMTVAATDPTLHQLAIIEVIQGSPAATAGLAAGDMIDSVDGAPITLGELYLRQRRGGPIHLVVRTGQVQRDVTVEPRAML